MPVTLVDTHVHVWNPETLHYPWLEQLPRLNRPVTPPVAADAEAVFVQADCVAEQGLDEVAWVESLDWPGLSAIVAYAPLHLGAAAVPWLQTLTAHPLVRGVRRLLQNEPDGFITSPGFLDGLRATAGAGLAFDATVRADQLGELARVHAEVPELALVLDHAGNPPRTADVDAAEVWREGLRAVATNPNAIVKLSGSASQCGVDVLMIALEGFGVNRAVLGSDHPLTVSDEPSAYESWASSAGSGLGLDGTELEQLRRLTADRVYGLISSAKEPHR